MTKILWLSSHIPIFYDYLNVSLKYLYKIKENICITLLYFII